VEAGIESEVGRLLSGAELWARLERDPSTGADGPLVLVAGWEDAFPGCGPFVAADGGRECRADPVALVAAALRSRRAVSDRCPFGTRLLAFPAPARSTDTAVVLRLDHEGGEFAEPAPGARAVLAAAHRLRAPGGLIAWQAEQRARGAERRRTAAAALAQMVTTTEEFHRLYTAADRDRQSASASVTRLDGVARETLRESEEARTRIAHELHDTAAQSMVGAHRFLAAAQTSLDGPDPARAARHLESADGALMTAIREVRHVLNTLVPPGLEELGLANALEIYVRDNVPDGVGAQVTGGLPRMEGWLEAGLFAMTVEAIRNAVAHAGATTIAIDLSTTRGSGIITVADDGVGFDPEAARRRSQEGLGLMGLTRRAGWLGGRVDVSSQPGDGTTIRICVPLGEAGGGGEIDGATTGGAETR
jgi:signal transduction histidine kinase